MGCQTCRAVHLARRGMPRRYPPEFRRKVLDLLKAGRSVVDVAHDLEISTQTIYNWRDQDMIELGLKPGVTSSDQAELVAARKRVVASAAGA